LLLSELPKNEPIRPDIKEIMSAADRAGVLTRQLLAFSRQQMLEPRVLDLNEVVEGMEQMLRRVLPADIKVTTKLDRSLGWVNADPGQLEQVLMNLIVNARDAMPEGGDLVIETRDARLDDADDTECPGAPAGDYVTLSVRDTGFGIAEPLQSRIFEPFFTTKEYGKGTGLGLSTAHGIITQSGGYIAVRSEPGLGATFKVYLPLVQSEPDTNVANAPVSTVTRGAETILLVEDDDAVRTTATRILERAGYTIYAAADGGEALAIHDKIGHSIDLLLTDMIMPEMSGGELTIRIREREPNVAVLVMSGYTEQTSLRQRLVDSGSAFIQKPFTPEELTAKVREALNATAIAQPS
jgi:CheY-like chemotaxis protein